MLRTPLPLRQTSLCKQQRDEQSLSPEPLADVSRMGQRFFSSDFSHLPVSLKLSSRTSQRRHQSIFRVGGLPHGPFPSTVSSITAHQPLVFHSTYAPNQLHLPMLY